MKPDCTTMACAFALLRSKRYRWQENRLTALVLSSIFLLPTFSIAACTRNPVIFNFGDSNSDTGGLVAGLGFPVGLPNGRLFFNRSTGRLSDGRLIVDFLCESLKTSLLSPYLDSLAGSTFRNGANFAIVGSSTLPRFVPFSLNIQLMQFIHFKTRMLELGTQASLGNEDFRNALYMIDIGQNDIADSFSKHNLTYEQVKTLIPSFVAEIIRAVQILYDQGGRNFWIHNTGPLGCLPQKLAMERPQSYGMDQNGCIDKYNAAAKLFNARLLRWTDRMRSRLPGASLVYVDIYSLKYDLISNSSRYGLPSPLMACCGFGGSPYNYNLQVTCGQGSYKVCDKGYRSVSWDGIHYTEFANSIVASRVLSSSHTSPPTYFDFFCSKRAN